MDRKTPIIKKKNESQYRYRASQKGIDTYKTWKASEIGQQYISDYNASQERKDSLAKYQRSEKGRINRAKAVKRYRLKKRGLL